jgi:dimethylamine monooxygenase subunit A
MQGNFDRTALPLVAPAMPFPVQAPYEVKSDLSKVSFDSFSKQLVIIDSQWPAYQAEKLRILANPDLQAVQGVQAASAQCSEALLTIADTLRADGPALAPLSENSVATQLDELALQLQDDVVLMRQEGERFYPELMHVCFPTGWNPAEKYAQTLASIHETVADGKRLVQVSQNLATAMVNKGPFVRYVWTLAAHAQLSQHPLEKVFAKEDHPIEQVYFRCERQITIPLPELNRSCFLIRVFIAPIQQIADTVERRTTLAAALQSMSEATVQYKGIAHLIPPVLTWIQTQKAHD